MPAAGTAFDLQQTNVFDKEDFYPPLASVKERHRHPHRYSQNEKEKHSHRDIIHVKDSHRKRVHGKEETLKENLHRHRSHGKECHRHKKVRHGDGKRSAEKQTCEERIEGKESMNVEEDHGSSEMNDVQESDDVERRKRRLEEWRSRTQFADVLAKLDDKRNLWISVAKFEECLPMAIENADVCVLPHESLNFPVLPHDLHDSPITLGKEKLVAFSVRQDTHIKAIDRSKQKISGISFDEEDDMECSAGIDEGCNSPCATTGEEELDPLDAYMNSVVLPEVQKFALKEASSIAEICTLAGVNFVKEKYSIDDTDSEDGCDENEALTDDDDVEFMKKVSKQSKIEKLGVVDHTSIKYEFFRKNFYIESKEIARMSGEEVSSYRKELDLSVHGKEVPKPVKTWHQTGLSSKALESLKKLGFEKLLPIQAQALPIIMSGRDCIGIAKTGSGKTLAFVLPMLRHIMSQEPLSAGDGPISLIMAPTRELVQQIYSDIKKFSKGMSLSVVAVYGGSGVAQQVNHLKRGAEIVVCTPGRMIDILCGKITSLKRVTYLVLDEADRMFDMGFEPQITRMIQNIRPDHQTVLFSATFPRQVEVLARKVLKRSIEIQVGGRSVVNKDITQIVEVRPESERFFRLLEVLGEQFEKGKILVFVHTQTKCDSLFTNLVKAGYPCLSLHGGKDQMDRDSTISDFKSNVCSLLIATSVAARGLDVKELDLVINYDVPNHYEDYVHRVGRTGRVGRKGCALTLISEDEARYAPDLVKALRLSEQSVPEDLKKLAISFMAKVKQGTEHLHGSGFRGRGFKYDEGEEETRRATKKAQAKEYGFDEVDDDSSDSESGNTEVVKAGDVSRHVVEVGACVSQTHGAVIWGQPALEATPSQQAAMEKDKTGPSGMYLLHSATISSMQLGGTNWWLHVRCMAERMPWNDAKRNIICVL